MYQDHIEIRVYGCHLSPYKIHKYLPMRIFALEYNRQIINSDHVDFISASKQTQFKIKTSLVLLSVIIGKLEKKLKVFTGNEVHQ